MSINAMTIPAASWLSAAPVTHARGASAEATRRPLTGIQANRTVFSHRVGDAAKPGSPPRGAPR